MEHLDYLKLRGRMPDFEEVFGPDKAGSATPSSGDDEGGKSEPWRRFPKTEPGAYLGNQPRFTDFLRKLNNKSARVLDVGCGMGTYRHEINRLGSYTGMDFDPALKPEVLCNFNIESFPFPDNSFDFVFSDSVLEHVMNPLAVMDEVYRVMKPGGCGYLLVPFHYKAHGAPWDFFRYSKAGVHLLLRQFTAVEIYPIGGSLSVLCHILWNYARVLDRLHMLLGNAYRCVIWCLFKMLNPLDRFDPYRVFTRGHYAFFRKAPTTDF